MEDIEEGLIWKRNHIIIGLMLKLVEMGTSKIGVDADIVACAAVQEDSEAVFKKAVVEDMNAEEAIVKMENVVKEEVTVEMGIGAISMMIEMKEKNSKLLRPKITLNHVEV